MLQKIQGTRGQWPLLPTLKVKVQSPLRCYTFLFIGSWGPPSLVGFP